MTWFNSDFLLVTCIPPAPNHHDNLPPYVRAKELEENLEEVLLHSGEEVRKILAMKTMGKGKRGRQTGIKERWEQIRFAFFPFFPSVIYNLCTFWTTL